jgi:hypothetical protein
MKDVGTTAAQTQEDNINASHEKIRWIDAFHIAGSIAPVTGISVLALDRIVGAVTIRKMVAAVLTSFLAPALLMFVVRLMLTISADLASRRSPGEGAYGRVGYWPVAIPVAFVVMAIAIRLLLNCSSPSYI